MDEISPSVGHDQLSRAVEDMLEMTIDECEVPFLVRKPDEGRCTVGQVTKTCLTRRASSACLRAVTSIMLLMMRSSSPELSCIAIPRCQTQTHRPSRCLNRYSASKCDASPSMTAWRA